MTLLSLGCQNFVCGFLHVLAIYLVSMDYLGSVLLMYNK